jgi:vacuolar protein sorting-associated protein 45
MVNEQTNQAACLTVLKSCATALQGVENVYTQHTPLLMQTLESVAKGRLKDVEYPSIDKSAMPAQPTKVQAPKLVVIFIVGGTTYEEARAVTELNAQSERHEGWASGIKFVLGGTSVQNSTSFMHDLGEMSMNEKMYST